MKGLLRTSVAVCLAALFLSGGIAEAQDLTIGNHTLISKKRVSRVEYEYTYTADVTNSGSQGFEDVSASVMSNSSHTLVGGCGPELSGYLCRGYCNEHRYFLFPARSSICLQLG